MNEVVGNKGLDVNDISKKTFECIKTQTLKTTAIERVRLAEKYGIDMK